MLVMVQEKIRKRCIKKKTTTAEKAAVVVERQKNHMFGASCGLY